MRRKLWIAALLAATTAGTACESEIATGPDSMDTAATDVGLAQIEATAGIIENDATRGGGGPGALFDRLANEIPGFGGFYFDDGCNLVVVLTDLAQSGHAIDTLSPLLRRYLNRAGRRCPKTAAVIVQAGDFTWHELTRYLAELRPVAQLRGVGRIAISVPHNRINIAVAANTLVQKVKHEAELLGVPPSVLEVIVAGD